MVIRLAIATYISDINLKTGNSLPPTGRITVKENGKPISDVTLTHKKGDVLTFGLCKRFLGTGIAQVLLGNIRDVKDVRGVQSQGCLS